MTRQRITQISLHFLSKNVEDRGRVRILSNIHRFLSSESNMDAKIPIKSGKEITIHWVKRDGTELSTACKVGGNLLRAAQANEIELEGACEGVINIFVDIIQICRCLKLTNGTRSVLARPAMLY